jgi:hypothetical protein
MSSRPVYPLTASDGCRHLSLLLSKRSLPRRVAKRRRLPLTVCIAARSRPGAIFCAADRMVTVGDMEMESPTPKIVAVSASIVIMPSDDDAAFHSEIIGEVDLKVKERIVAEPSKWWTIQEVVDLYIAIRNKHRNIRAERDILIPLGLNYEKYHTQQAALDKDLVRQIAVDLVNYKLPHMDVIIAGIDPTGPHIFDVHSNHSGDIETGRHDAIGYAAIGAGMRHATAHFLLSKQAYDSSLPDTLWNTYVAKKRSEVAPGVGETTDLVMIGPALGAQTLFGDPILPQLETVYKRAIKRAEKSSAVASREINSYVGKIAESAAEQSKKQAAPPPTESAHASQPGSSKPAEEQK